jgi:hypothetical protein
MKKRMLLSAILFGVCLWANSAGERASTSWQFNGHGWLTMTPPQKLSYLRGMYDGLSLGQEAGGLIAKAPMQGMTFGEIRTALDAFYADASNVRIPVLFAHVWLKHKVGGASPQELDAEAAKFRRMFANGR